MSVNQKSGNIGRTDSLHVVGTFQRAMAATAFVGLLDDQGIRAESVGEHTAGFAAEAPGVVEVLVSESDWVRAKELFADFEKHGAQVDWSQVDVGDDSPIAEDEDANQPRRYDLVFVISLILYSVLFVVTLLVLF